MSTEQQTCLEHGRADLTIAEYRIKASLQRLLASQEHGPLPPGGIDLSDDLRAMLCHVERLGTQFEQIIMAARKAVPA